MRKKKDRRKRSYSFDHGSENEKSTPRNKRVPTLDLPEDSEVENRQVSPKRRFLASSLVRSKEEWFTSSSLALIAIDSPKSGLEKQTEWANFEAILKDAYNKESKQFQKLFEDSASDFEICHQKRDLKNPAVHQFLVSIDLGIVGNIFPNINIKKKKNLLSEDKLNAFSKECVTCLIDDFVVLKGSAFDRCLDQGSGETHQSRKLTTVTLEKGKTFLSPRLRETNEPTVKRNNVIDTTFFQKSTDQSIQAVTQSMKVKNLKHKNYLFVMSIKKKIIGCYSTKFFFSIINRRFNKSR